MSRKRHSSNAALVGTAQPVMDAAKVNPDIDKALGASLGPLVFTVAVDRRTGESSVTTNAISARDEELVHAALNRYNRLITEAASQLGIDKPATPR